MKKFLTAIYLLFFLTSQAVTAQIRKIWFDTDLLIGNPERAPREVDDAVTLIMALRSSTVDIKGISLITSVNYGKEVANRLLGWYAPTKPVPVYKGSDKADDLGTENEATRALETALAKDRLTIVAIGPMTNVATVVKNHPELISRIEEIVCCAGRTPGFAFKPGLQKATVSDYNFERDPSAFKVLLATQIPMVLSGFECSSSLLLGPVDIDRLKTGMEGDRWVYSQLMPWIARGYNLFGSEGFIPYDTTVLGYLTHPSYFKFYENIPIEIHERMNDATLGANLGKVKSYLEVSYDYPPNRKVKFAYKTLPGFQQIVEKALLGSN